jgi:thiol-disulfide isomerase/thioredoxin
MRTLLPLLVASIVASSCFAGAATRLPALKATRWVNSPLLTPEGLRGKVVLVDVWEYTCINWIRTLPYIKAWNRQYADLGLVVVGVHSRRERRPWHSRP